MTYASPRCQKMPGKLGGLHCFRIGETMGLTRQLKQTGKDDKP